MRVSREEGDGRLARLLAVSCDQHIVKRPPVDRLKYAALTLIDKLLH
jgi:hypothetical protein